MNPGRIVQVANFVAPTSGGIRTCLDALGRGYVDAGYDRVLVVPGAEDAIDGDRVVLRGRRLPGQPYRVLTDVDRVRVVVTSLRPDRIEVSDKLTLGSLGRLDVPSLLLSHERIDAILRPRVPPGFPLRAVADAANRRLADAFDTVVCASAFAAEEWQRVDVDPVVVPLGVDLETFHPAAGGARRRHEVELACVGRLSTEKRPQVALAALRELRSAGVDAGLTVVGNGPLLARLEAVARRRRLPVRFLGHLADRDVLAAVLAAADVVVCPCPHETFGLAAVEAMACGTPVAVPAGGALAELVAGGPLGCGAVDDHLAAAVRLCLRTSTRGAARRAAEAYPWRRTVDGLLAAHGLTPAGRRAAA